MAKRRVTIEVDTSKMFDALHANGGNAEWLGARLASALLAGDVDLRDTLGLGIYGIGIIDVQTLNSPNLDSTGESP